MKKKVKDWFGFFAPRFLCLTLLLGLIVRIALIVHPLTTVDWGWTDWLKIPYITYIEETEEPPPTEPIETEVPLQ